MKKIGLFLISLIMMGCSGEHPSVPASDSSNIEYLYIKDGYGSISLRIKRFVYDNHEYIMMQSGRISGIVHNPDCKYCKEQIKRNH